ncbi:MAG: hypothetical protein ACR2HX_09170, partial [Pyrinomonadaceae bacterium]
LECFEAQPRRWLCSLAGKAEPYRTEGGRAASSKTLSLLRDELSSRKDESGNPFFDVTTRDRESDAAGNDPVLSALDTTNFDELWLFAVDSFLDSFVSKKRSARFLEEAATYSYQLNVLLPVFAALREVPQLSEEIRGFLNTLRTYRNDIAHRGTPKKPIEQNDMANC